MIGMGLARAALRGLLAVVLRPRGRVDRAHRAAPRPRTEDHHGDGRRVRRLRRARRGATRTRKLARFGVELDLRETTEGFATLKSLVEGNGEVDAGFVKGGLIGGLHGAGSPAPRRATGTTTS